MVLKPAQVSRLVFFECGCQCTLPYLGAFSARDNPQIAALDPVDRWHVIPCYQHATRINSNVLFIHDICVEAQRVYASRSNKP